MEKNLFVSQTEVCKRLGALGVDLVGDRQTMPMYERIFAELVNDADLTQVSGKTLAFMTAAISGREVITTETALEVWEGQVYLLGFEFCAEMSGLYK